MKKRSKLALVSSAVLLSAGIMMPGNVSTTEAAPANIVNMPPVSGFIDHDELTRELNQLERTSQGNVDVEVAGYSNQGLEVYKTTVGTGDKVVLLQSEIHGNEKVGTQALLEVLKQVGGNNSPDMRQLREELTIVAIPMMNPDGSELNRRGNEMTWDEVVESFPNLENASPTWNYYTYVNQYWDYESNPGFDVNRDFNPDLDYTPQPEDFPGSSEEPGWYVTPEAQTVRDVYKDLQNEFGKVDVFVDLHHQGEYYIDGTDDPVTLSLSGVFVPDPNTEEGEKYSEYSDLYDVDFSKQLNIAAYDALQQRGNSPFGNISLYPQDVDLPGTALGTFALNGSGAVIFEITGQTQNFGQKKMGQLRKATELGLFGILDSVATGEVYDLDVDRYHDIPETDR